MFVVLCLLTAILSAPASREATASASVPRLIVAIGAPGEDKYAELFAAWSNRWEAAAEQGGVSITVIGRSADGPTDRERLQAALAEAAASPPRELWIVLIGHGTFDRRSAKFNLRGPDVSADDLKTWLAGVKAPTAVVDCSAASAPFLQALAGPNRVVISATKSGGEQNFARFGEFLSQAVADPAADLDKDDQTSLWEAFLAASRKTDEFYQTDGRLQTEHPLLDDNGDKRGTPPDWFRGTRATKRAEGGAAPDGVHAHRIALVQSAAERALTPAQRATRDRLEEELERLRERKSSMTERDYLRELELLLRQIGAIYQPAAVETPPAPTPDAANTSGT